MADGAENAIEQMCKEHNELIAHLLETNKVSWQSRVEEQFAKALLLAAASYFETRITACVVELFSEATMGSDALVSFVQTKAVARQYHGWFDWNAKNANQFFRAFGEDFRQVMSAKVRDERDLDAAVKAFLEIGALRNALVHKNYATFSMPKTSSEVLEQYQTATRFVDVIADELRNYVAAQQAGPVC